MQVFRNADRGGGLVGGHVPIEDLVEHADGFAEVYPEHKYAIVKLLQERHHMVGMTGASQVFNPRPAQLPLIILNRGLR